MNRFVPVNKPVFLGNEKKYLMECIDTGWISSEGPYVKKLEEGIASFVGRKYGCAVCNGTAALEAAVLALNLETGAEVIIPDFTIISCAQAVIKAGLIPVPVDCGLEDFNIDVKLIETKITDKTRAIMVAHIYGMPVDMDAVVKIAKKYNLLIIEDAAEAHGLTYKGKQCGSFGDVSIFSFYPNKHITCGEGGIVLTDNEAYIERANAVRNLFFDKERRYIHSELGSNFRMTNMQAALGVAQLEYIDKTIEKKREIGKIYQEGLFGIKSFKLPIETCSYANNVYWVFGLVSINRDITADFAMKKLGEKGIATRHFFYPMHKQPALINGEYLREKDKEESLYPNANYLAEYGFYIPSGLGITREDQEYVISVIRELFL